MELQARLPEFERAGTAVFAVSYDPVSVLADFARAQGITFPLLSDEGSETIRRLGLLNQHVAAQQAFYGRGVEARHEGIPYPGLFFLDEAGMVVDRQFEQSYRVRPAPDVLLEDVAPASGAPAGAVTTRAESEGVRVDAWIGTETYRPYQKLHVHLVVSLESGLHVYAAPTPAGFTSLTVDVEPIDEMVVETAELPAPHPLRMEGIPEELFVHEGTIPMTVPIHIDANQGDVSLAIRVRYQACTDHVCYPPSALTVILPLRAVDLVRA